MVEVGPQREARGFCWRTPVKGLEPEVAYGFFRHWEKQSLQGSRRAIKE
jgi:hypothetical protein